MNPNMDNGRRRRRHLRREERDNRRLMWSHAGAKRQRKLTEFLQKKSAKQRSITPREKTDANNSESQVKTEEILPYDLLFKILSLLPAESLCKVQFVCKQLFNLINSSAFIEFHTQQSETVLIARDLIIDRTSTGCLILPPLEKPKPHFHCLDLDHGNDNFVEASVIDLVSIQASCDGLVLGVTAKNKSLMLINPLTRKHTKLPFGTIGFAESYGFGYCNQGRTYKVVHLFREESGYTVCEILNITTRIWTCIDGPPPELLHDVKQMPISASGSLYWMPWQHGCDYFVSLNLQDQQFVTQKLPIFCAVNDRLIEIGGVLGFVTHAKLNLMQVWVLNKSGASKENWIKRYSIYLTFDVRRVVPICSSRNGKEIVFEYPGHYLYVYNIENDEMKEVYSRDDEEYFEAAEKLFIPHRNTLASWEDRD